MVYLFNLERLTPFHTLAVLSLTDLITPERPSNYRQMLTSFFINLKLSLAPFSRDLNLPNFFAHLPPYPFRLLNLAFALILLFSVFGAASTSCLYA